MAERFFFNGPINLSGLQFFSSSPAWSILLGSCGLCGPLVLGANIASDVPSFSVTWGPLCWWANRKEVGL